MYFHSFLSTYEFAGIINSYISYFRICFLFWAIALYKRLNEQYNCCVKFVNAQITKTFSKIRKIQLTLSNE